MVEMARGPTPATVKERMRTVIIIIFMLLPLAAPPLFAQDSTNPEEADILPGIDPGREVITIESGKFKLETDLLNREMEAVLEKQRPEWNEKPPLLTSDDRVSRSLRREYRRKKIELEKTFAREDEEEDLDHAGPDDLEPSLGMLVFEGLARTQPRVYRKEPLSIKERMERANKEEALLKQALKELGSKEGRLRWRVQQEPLRSHQERLAKISLKIKKLKKTLAGATKDTGLLWRSLGEAYLESQHHLESLRASERLILIRHAEVSDTTLGSYELAGWALKQAVAKRPEDREIHLLLSETYEKLEDEATALMHAKFAENLTGNRR